jgi:hypothetical protein
MAVVRARRGAITPDEIDNVRLAAVQSTVVEEERTLLSPEIRRIRKITRLLSPNDEYLMQRQLIQSSRLAK